MTNELLTWLLTSTTYGTWLPGDARGFVGRVWDTRPEDPATESLRVQHDVLNTPHDRDIPGLEAAAWERMKGDPVLLDAEQAEAVLTQFQKTATYREWELHAASVMANHVHLVVAAPASVLSDDLLRDFKSYASRILNSNRGKPKSGTWWTASGRLASATTNGERHHPRDSLCSGSASLSRSLAQPLPWNGRTMAPERRASARRASRARRQTHGGLTPAAR